MGVCVCAAPARTPAGRSAGHVEEEEEEECFEMSRDWIMLLSELIFLMSALHQSVLLFFLPLVESLSVERGGFLIIYQQRLTTGATMSPAVCNLPLVIDHARRIVWENSSWISRAAAAADNSFHDDDFFSRADQKNNNKKITIFFFIK